jgi:hypothetical protein
MAEPESSRPASVILLALLTVAVGGAALGGRLVGDSGSKGEPPAKKGTVPAAMGAPGATPLNALRSYVDTGKSDDGLLKEFQEHYSRLVHDYLIVTVPDPIDSRFGFVFDELVAVVKRALEESSYVFDRYWLPWVLDRKKLAEKEPDVRVHLDLLGRTILGPVQNVAGEGAFRERFPGLILFRRMPSKEEDDQRVKLFMVLLVGENPTSGVDKRALTSALGLANCLAASEKKCFKIVGPYFTGSQTSVQSVLEAWHERFPEHSFRVISGAAGAIEPHLILPRGGKETPVSTFRATVIPPREILKATLHYVKNRTGTDPGDKLSSRPDDVAFLFEANTGFGRSVKGSIQKSWTQRPARNQLLLPFPLHISGVAANYEKVRQLKEEQLGLPRIEALIPRLGITQGDNSDLIPAQDPATTASVNGKELTNILSVIARKQMRYVGIAASDPRDTIFLASSIRDHSPGVQIFILGSDLLYCLPDFSPFLRGTIIGSTYPLITANQRWTNPQITSRLIFPSDWAQGYYNAIYAQFAEDHDLLVHHSKLLEYGPPLFRDPATAERKTDRPPIWITMIGQNGELLPLQFFTKYDKDKANVWPSKEQPHKRLGTMELHFPSTALLVFLAVCTLAGVVLTRAFGRTSPQPLWPVADGGIGQTSFWWGMLYRFAYLLPLTLLLLFTEYLGSIYLLHGLTADRRSLEATVLMFLPFLLGACVIPALIMPLLPALREKVLAWQGACAAPPLWMPFAVAALLAFAATAPWLASPFGGCWGGTPGSVTWYFTLFVYPSFLAVLVYGLGFVESWRGAGAQTWPSGSSLILLVVCVWAYFVAYVLVADARDPSAGEALFFFRALNFPGGITPLLPLAFLCAALFVFAYFRMKARWDHYHATPSPYAFAAGGCYDRVRTHGEQLEAVTACEYGALRWLGLRHRGGLILLLSLTGLGVVWMGVSFMPTPEGRFMSWFFFTALTLGFLFVAANLIRFCVLWSRLKDLLRELTLIPMATRFGKLPEIVVNEFHGYLFPRRVRQAHRERVQEQQLVPLYQETGRQAADILLVDMDDAGRKRAEQLIADARAFERDGRRARLESSSVPGGNGWSWGEDRTEIDLAEEQQRMSELAGRLLMILPWLWRGRTVGEAFGMGRDTGGNKEGPQGTPPAAKPCHSGPSARWIELAEEFVAIQVVNYVSQFFVQLRTLAWSMVTCAVLVLFAATCYPFQPERLILYTMLTLIGVVLGAILIVLVQVNRDELVSRITGTTPYRFTLDMGFIRSVFTFVVPTVSLVALQLSGTFRFLLEPVVRVLR